MNNDSRVMRQLQYIEEKYNCKFEITKTFDQVKIVKIVNGDSKKANRLLRKLDCATDIRFGLKFWPDLREKYEGGK